MIDKINLKINFNCIYLTLLIEGYIKFDNYLKCLELVS